MSLPMLFQDVDRQEPWSLTYTHAAITADATIKLYKVPTGRSLVLTRVSYINPTGLAADNTNAFRGTVNNGATVAAAIFNTDGNDDPVGAALPADTFVDGVLATAQADRVFEAGEIVSFVADEDGDTTLPIGTLRLEGRLL